MSKEFEKASILKDADVSYSASTAPAPPAGDVEGSVADVVMFEGEKIIDGTLAYMETAVVGDRLYSAAHVTRLTAELEAERREHAETELISQQEELRANDYATQLVSAQSDLTKARESMLDVISNLGEFCCGLDSQEQVDYITSQLDKLAHQSAPAAKGGGA